MRHHQKGRKLGRVKKVRTQLVRSLVQALVEYERIETTLAKAKELRPIVERMVTLAKKDTLASRRLLSARLGNDVKTTKKLHTVIAPRYKERNGGYTRISKLGAYEDTLRDKVIIEFV